MISIFKCLMIIFLLLVAINNFSQEKTKTFNSTLLSESIYFPSLNQSSELNSFYNINKKLNFKSYKFVILDAKSIEEGYFTVPFKNFGQEPTSYIFDTYQKIYHNHNLKKSFFKLADLYKVPNRK